MGTESFHTTRWTLVRHASARSTEGRQALHELCATYYEPLVAFLRRDGRDPEAARETAHEFFARLLEAPNLGGAEPGRGRFRSYLLGALKHHLSHERESMLRQKRGGGAETIPLEPGTDTSPGFELGDARSLPPDREFDREWALQVLRLATEALATEWQSAGKGESFATLQPFIGGEGQHGELAALAERLGESASTLRKTLSRMRHRFRQLVKAQLVPTLAESAEVDDEMRALLAALAS
jgi:DNA-directed RNA polymerase specialized sigma24 family protein